jgi:predicted nucleic acid-binding protein
LTPARVAAKLQRFARELEEHLAPLSLRRELLGLDRLLSVLRRLLRAGKLEALAADQARLDHFAFTITRHETAPFSERIWELRHQFTSYLALAQVLQAPLYSCDAKLAKRGHNAEVHLLAQRRDQPMCGSRLGRTRAYPCLNRRSCADT